MKLSVVIVNYKVGLYLCQCLDSLRRALCGVDAEVFVVDNHSADGSVELVKRHFPEVRVIESNHNLGFSRANNLAIRRSNGEYVLLLNPDTFVAEDSIAHVLEFMDAHPRAGAAGVCMMGDDGRYAKESRRGLPTPLVAFYKFCGLCSLFPRSRRFGRYYMGWLPWDEPARVDVLSGAFCMLRRSALDAVGLLDEDYFMYGEDVDLSYRMLKGGYENWYVPACILHYKGESAHRSSFRYVHVFYNAMLIFYRKHFARRMWFVSVPVKAAILGKAMCALVSMWLTSARKSLGFVSKQRDAPVRYVFVGAADTLDECRRLAERCGLDALFVDVKSLPHGSAGFVLDAQQTVCMVYDMGVYNYVDILKILDSRTDSNTRIGTYCRETGAIITGEEVIV